MWHTSPLPPCQARGDPLGTKGPPRDPSCSRYLLPPSTPHQEPGQLLHTATTLAPAQGGRSGLSPLAGCPHRTVTMGVSQRGREPVLSSVRSAPQRFTAGEAHVPRGVPAAAGGDADSRVSCALQSVPGHEHNKDSRLLWMGSSDCLISVGFSQVRSLPGKWPWRYQRVPATLPAGAFFGWPVPHESRRSPHQVTWLLLGVRGRLAGEGGAR